MQLLTFQWRRKSKCFETKWHVAEVATDEDPLMWRKRAQEYCKKVEIVLLGTIPVSDVDLVEHLTQLPFDPKANIVKREHE